MSRILVTIVALAAGSAPAVIVATPVGQLRAVTDGHDHVYVAGTAFLWGFFSMTIVAVATRWLRGPSKAVPLQDFGWGLGALATLSAWIFAVYTWNIAKFGGIELDAVGPTTRLWPFVVVVAATILVPMRHGSPREVTVVLAASSAAIGLLALDVALATIGALRDGSVSGLGLIVGFLSVLEIGILGAWLTSIRRSRMRGQELSST